MSRKAARRTDLDRMATKNSDADEEENGEGGGGNTGLDEEEMAKMAALMTPGEEGWARQQWRGEDEDRWPG